MKVAPAIFHSAKSPRNFIRFQPARLVPTLSQLPPPLHSSTCVNFASRRPIVEKRDYSRNVLGQRGRLLEIALRYFGEWRCDKREASSYRELHRSETTWRKDAFRISNFLIGEQISRQERRAKRWGISCWWKLAAIILGLTDRRSERLFALLLPTR